MTQFNRSASVFVRSTELGLSLTIRNLRVVFTVEKTEDKTPNKATIEIYNMNSSTRSAIENGALIILNAGYLGIDGDGDGEEVLFVGTITHVSTNFPLPDVITVIEALDGKDSLGKTKTTINQTGGIGGTRILKDILATFPISNNLQSVSFEDKIYQSGFSFAGMSKDALTKVTKFLNLEWSIQNNEIKITQFDESDETQVLSIRPETGMIGSPERLAGETRKSKAKSKKNQPGWSIEALLAPKLVPNGKVAVTSREIAANSIFIIYSVSHRGDTDGAEWTSEFEVREKAA